MKLTPFILSACCLCLGVTACSSHDAPAAAATQAAEAPASVAGKRIYFDFSGAIKVTGDLVQRDPLPYINWNNDETPMSSQDNELSPLFGSNNQGVSHPEDAPPDVTEEDIRWTYTKSKTSPSFATISCRGHEYDSKYGLKFDTPTSGAAICGPGNELSGYYKITGIRFSIK